MRASVASQLPSVLLGCGEAAWLQVRAAADPRIFLKKVEAFFAGLVFLLFCRVHVAFSYRVSPSTVFGYVFFNCYVFFGFHHNSSRGVMGSFYFQRGCLIFCGQTAVLKSPIITFFDSLNAH